MSGKFNHPCRQAGRQAGRHKTYSYFQGTSRWLLLWVKVCDQEFYRADPSSLKLLLRWNMARKFPNGAIFKKSSFSLFWTSFKQILLSEHKRLSRHRLYITHIRKYFFLKAYFSFYHNISISSCFYLAVEGVLFTQ